MADEVSPEPTLAQLPQYRSHKVVGALKIAKIEGNVLTPADSQFAPFLLDKEYLRKHSPEAGGYYVVYSDGYKSFSPAKAFEEGYTLVP
jgi:hypothetical protein